LLKSSSGSFLLHNWLFSLLLNIIFDLTVVIIMFKFWFRIWELSVKEFFFVFNFLYLSSQVLFPDVSNILVIVLSRIMDMTLLFLNLNFYQINAVMMNPCDLPTFISLWTKAHPFSLIELILILWLLIKKIKHICILSSWNIHFLLYLFIIDQFTLKRIDNVKIYMCLWFFQMLLIPIRWILLPI